MIPSDFLRTVADSRGVSDSELEALILALESQSMDSIAQKLDIKPEAVRKRLGEVYRKFQIAGKGPGKLARLQKILLGEYQQHTKLRVEDNTASLTAFPQDWGWSSAPDVEPVYGRTQELSQLEDWIVTDGSRLIAIAGMGGIGKTTLAVKIAKQLESSQGYSVIWRSMRHYSSIYDLLGELLQLITRQPGIIVSDDLDRNISLLVSYLRAQKYLLIFDDFEAVLAKERLAGHYAEGAQGYEVLIRRIATEPHQSCLIFASAEKLADLALLEGMKVHTLQLGGSAEVAEFILQDRGIELDDFTQRLIETYGGNPLAVKIVSDTIREVYQGETGSFLQDIQTFFMGDLRYLLDQQFERLSEREKDLVDWLAVLRRPVRLFDLQETLVELGSDAEILEIMGSLSRRSLVEKQVEGKQAFFTLQTVVMKYAIAQLVDQIRDEFITLLKQPKIEYLNCFKAYPFDLDDPKDSRSLISLVKKSLKNKLFRQSATLNDQFQRLTDWVENLEATSTANLGHSIENLRFLLAQLNTES